VPLIEPEKKAPAFTLGTRPGRRNVSRTMRAGPWSSISIRYFYPRLTLRSARSPWLRPMTGHESSSCLCPRPRTRA